MAEYEEIRTPEQLRERIRALEVELRQHKRDLFDFRRRFVLIGTILEDRARTNRAPQVTLGTISNILYAGPATLHRIVERYVNR